MTPDIIDIYTDIAAWFDSARDKSGMERAHLDRALTASGIASPSVLDLGCGSGEPIAAYLIARGCHVTGIDGAAPLVDLCRARFPNHQWHVADMRTLDLPHSFNIIIAWHSFFHLTRDEQRAMFPLFARYLGIGGILVFTSGPDDGVAWGEIQGHRVHHASLSADAYIGLAASHGFERVHHVCNDDTCGGATVWTFKKVKEAAA